MRLYTHTRFLFFIFLSLTGSLLSVAQPAKDLPTDYLSPAFHAGRRAALRQAMPANSVAVIISYPVRNFSNDVDYLYHANPDMYYFSGYKEPNSLLLVFKEPQTDSAGNTYDEVLFVQKKNAAAEQWTGRRLGTEGAVSQLGVKKALNGEDFKNLAINFAGFSEIILDELPQDIADSKWEKADIYDLVQQLKQKASIPDDYKKDKRFAVNRFHDITSTLRQIKTPEEMGLLRKAVEISCRGQNEVMKAVRPDMSELEIQGLHEYVHKRYGAEGAGYGAIVGAGDNGCVLHYMENSKTRVGQSMIVMDVGAEYHGYTADVTRSIPASGKFSAEEKLIYQLVYDAQEAAFKTLKNGSSWTEADKVSRNVITEGLVKLGVAKTKAEAAKYYPHGLGHHIGLDVHDRGKYDTIRKDMVITIEPGIYISSGSNCDKKWWGIGVRIEDDALITETGYELLSRFAPRSIAEIEKMMAEKTVLENYKLPVLESGDKNKKGF